MAKDKKSFVGYCDWRNTFDLLSDDEAGKLIKHFFAYVNDEDPVLDDRLLQMAFEPIKTQLKRDLSKYEEVKKKRAEAGRQGGLRSGENRNKQNEANASDVTDLKANEAIASSAKQTEANEADNVNDNGNVNDNVNDNVILLEKETKGEEVPADNFSPPSDKNNFSDELETGKSLSKPPPVAKRKKVAQKKENVSDEELMIPEDFKPIWSDWLEYRKAKKKKPYAGVKWEQIAVDKFLENSGNDPKIGRKILNQTIACNWEGLFKLKKEYNSEESTRATGEGSSKGGSVRSGQVSGKNNQFTIEDFTLPS